MTMLLWLKRTNFFIFVLRILMPWKDVFLWLYFCTWAGNELHVVAWNNADNIESQAQSFVYEFRENSIGSRLRVTFTNCMASSPAIAPTVLPSESLIAINLLLLASLYRKTTNGTLLFKWKSRMDIKLSLYDHHCRLAKLVILSQLTHWTTLEISSLFIQLMF